MSALDGQVVDDETPMAFSLRAPMVGAPATDVGAPVHFETTGAGGGIVGTWATAAEVDQEGVTNLDSLEIWGADTFDDTTHFSAFGDATVGRSILTVAGRRRASR